MPRALLSLWLVLGASLAVAQSSSDWQFFGESDGEVMFFSAANTQKLPDGHLQVWTESLSGKQVEAAGAKVLQNEQTLQRVAMRILVSAPVVANIQKLSEDQLKEVALDEEVANHAELSPLSRVLWEVDCPGRMMRTLSIHGLKNGKRGAAVKAGDWTPVPPESSGEMLHTLVCRSQ